MDKILFLLQSGELVVMTRYSPTTYFEDADGKLAGLEHDLVLLFAQDLNVRLRFVVARQFSDIIPAVENREVNFAAAGLTITDSRKNRVVFGTPYQGIVEQVAYNTDESKPQRIQDLIGKRIEVVAGSSYVDKLKAAQVKFPGLEWKEIPHQETEELLERLSMAESDYVLTDSHILTLSQNYYPNIAPAFDISRSEYLAWAFPQRGSEWLQEKAKAFFARIQKDGTLKRLLDRYYGHIERLERADVEGLLQKMNSTLPQYRDLFQQAQQLTGLDWRLLAALGYQESHWDPLATSPTGVRGLMMLTNDTADEYQVTDRLDPRQNISAGAKYFLAMKDTVPARIPEPDRTWIALAAYNVGYGHVEDARVLAAKLKLNPDSWADLKKTLPLLSKSQYFNAVKHGYARGGEPVIFVENIRTYFDILAKFQKPNRQLFQVSEKTAEREARGPVFSVPPM
jgi:membrane-bound lytic murein transglycosylase F